MDATRPRAWGRIGLWATGASALGACALAACALAACGGRVGAPETGSTTGAAAGGDAAEAAEDAPDAAATPEDAAASVDARAGLGTGVDESDAGVDAGPAECVQPTLPRGYFCAPPGGTTSTAFDPIACGVPDGADGGAACRAQCAAWFGSPLYATFCVAADAPYVDAGPPGFLVCACNIP